MSARVGTEALAPCLRTIFYAGNVTIFAMRPEQWKKVEQVLEAVLEQPVDARAQILTQHCNDDDELRREVEALMRAHEQAGDFIDKPLLAGISTNPDHDSPAPLHDALTAFTGKRVGAYRIEREIGRGGMGAVYLAVRDDNTFQKRVAIKIVKRGMDTDFILRRFRRERQILATLSHQNIAALLDGGSTEEGLPYFVLEYVPGQPINHFCDARKLTVQERLHLMQQVCAAVSYAHQKQIVHRDIKPGNILVTPEGAVKLLDFGIAKLLDPDLAGDTVDQTATTVRLMTPEYASPEQVRGLPVTPATDVYSLGVLLYELLTGRRPYRLASHAPHEIMRVICEEEPTRPSAASTGAGNIPYSEDRATTPDGLRAALTGNLDNIILKALRKDAQQRYATAQELSHDITRHLSGETISIQLAPSVMIAPRNLLAEAPNAPSIAVLPLNVVQASKTDETGDQYLGIGIADALTTQLGNMRGLIVRPTSAVMRCCAGDDPFASGKELGVDYLLDGRVQLARDRMRVTMQLISMRDKAVLWAAQFNEKLTDILVVQDSIAAQVAEAIIPKLTGEDRARLAKRGTDDLQAYEAYLRGRYHWHSYSMENLARALVYFHEAISRDPAFAAPYAGIAEYYNRLATFGVVPASECFAAAKEAALQAVRLDETLAEAWAALAFATLGADWDRKEGMRLIHRALELNPHSVQVHEWYAHLLGAAGKQEEAIAAIERALQLDNSSSALHILHSFYLYLANHPAASWQANERALQLDPDSFWALFAKAGALERAGRKDEALATAHSLVTKNEGNLMSQTGLAISLYRAGQLDEARALLHKILDSAETGYVSPYFIAAVCDGVGERSQALQWIEKGLATRDWWMLYLPYDPMLAKLYATPQCQTLAQRAGLIAAPTTPENLTTIADTQFANYAAAPRQSDQPRATKRVLIAAGLMTILVVSAFALYQFFGKRPSQAGFHATTATKLTTNGNAVLAAISPDGKYVAYVIEEAGKQSLWMRQVTVASSVRLVPPAATEYRGLHFSADGAFVRYVAAAANVPSALYEVPALGGSVRKIKGDVDSPIGVAPNGKQIAYVRHIEAQGKDDLLIADNNGANERVLVTRQFPEHFSLRAAPLWSPANDAIAVVVETSDEKGFFMKAVEIQIQKASEKPLTAQRWMTIDQMNWTPEGRGLLLAGQDAESPFVQLWFMQDGQTRRLTNDMSDYKGLSLPANFQAMVTVQRQTLINIWVAPKGAIDRRTQITTGAGRYFDLAWTPDGSVLYASDASGSADIWERQISSGSEQLQLTAGASRNYAPVSAPDGKHVIFHSNRSGNWQIWQMGRDGSNQIPLTSGNEESNWPQISPDGRWIVYEHFGAGTLTTLWKKMIEGGEPIRLTKTLSMRPAISPDGKFIACWSKDETPNAPWKISLIAMTNGALIQQFDVSQNDASGSSVIRWMPDGRSVVYIDYRHGTTSLLRQSLAGGAPQKILESANEVIYSFDIAPDGSIAYSRGLRANDVVLLTEAGKAD